MKRRFFLRASTLAVATGTLILTSCSTPQTRISEHPDLYQSLSHRDQALVSQGQIRIGMSRTAVWLAWGSPDRKIVGNMGGGPTETWLYIYYATLTRTTRVRPLDVYFGAPLYDPFCYSWFPPSIPYPGKVVTFAHGRVVSFQYVTSPLEPIKNSVALWRVTDEYSSGSDPWLTAHFDSSSMLLNKRAN